MLKHPAARGGPASKVLRPAFARILTPVVEALARTPITPNALTIIGTIGMSAGALTLFPTGHLFIGVVVCTGFVFTDMLDGQLARIKGTTGKFGAFLDSTMDRVADASVFGGLAAWFVLGGHDKLLAGVALFCLVAGSLVSYAKARAESLGLSCDVGFAERTERLLIGLVATGLSGLGVPYVLPIGLWLLAAASLFTFGQRVLAARRSAAEIAAAETKATAGPPAADRSAATAASRQAPADVPPADQPGSDRPPAGQPGSDRPAADKPGGDRPASDEAVDQASAGPERGRRESASEG
jgi:CDP-diacylglycerol--glycerol-3-phosphate 3-phosphatidyltransferase